MSCDVRRDCCDVVTEASEVVDGQVEHKIGLHIAPMSVISTVGIIMCSVAAVSWGAESAIKREFRPLEAHFEGESTDSLQPTQPVIRVKLLDSKPLIQRGSYSHLITGLEPNRWIFRA
jgi:hypothetical protein